MADVTVADPSIYNNLWKPDPMAGVNLQQKYLGIQQARQQNQLTQQDLDFRQGLAENEAASINEDGTQNTGKFNLLNARNPKTAWKMQELYQQGNQLNTPTEYVGHDQNGQPINKGIPAQYYRTLPGQPGNQLQPQQMQQPSDGNQLPPQQSGQTPDQNQGAAPPSDEMIQNTHGKLSALHGAATELANDPNATRADAIRKLVDLKTSGHLTDPEAIKVFTDPNDPLPGAGQPIAPWAGRHAAQLAPILQRLGQHPAVIGQNQSSIESMPNNPIAQKFGQPQAVTEPAPAPQVAAPGSFDAALLQHQQQAPKGNNSPGVDMSVPRGYDQKLATSQGRIKQVQDDATAVPAQNAIFSQIEDLSKSGAPTGDIVAKGYKFLSEKGLVSPASTEEKQREEIVKYMEQAALAAGMPTSDARLASVHSANVNENQLPAAIQGLTSFFKAANQGKVLKEEYYNKVLGDQLNPDQEIHAKQLWDQNYDPRIIEFKSLPDAAAKKTYLADHPDFKSLIPKIKTLHQMGVIQ